MARDFNGTTDRLDWASIDNLAGDALTISAWIYIDAQNAGNNAYILGMHDSGDTAIGLVFNLVGIGSSLNFTRVGSTVYSWYDAGTTNTGVWRHVLITSNGGLTSGDATLYIGGNTVIQGFTNGSGAETAHTGSWSVGGRIPNDTRNFDGKLAEVAVWNTVLSTGTISALASGRVATAFPDNLLFYWMGRENDLFADPPDTTGTADGTTFSSLHPTTNFQTTLSKTLDSVTFSSSGTVANPPSTGRTATLAKTLDGVVFSSVATNANFVDLSKTLGNVISSSSGTVAEIGYQIDDIILEWLEVSTATLSKTLDNATVSSSAKVTNESDLSKTLSTVLASSSGKNSNLADASKTLDGVTETSSGKVSNYTDLSSTLASITNTSSGTGAIGGSSDESLDDDTFDSEVDVAIVSNLSKTLADATLSSSGIVGASANTATLSKTLDSITNVSSGTNAIGGDTDETLGEDTFDAEADVSIYGNTSTTLATVSLSSSGVNGLASTGSLDVTLDGVSSSGAGTVAIGVDLSVILAAVTLIATGIVTPLPVTPSTFLPRWKYDVPYYDRNYVVSEYNRTHRTEDTEG